MEDELLEDDESGMEDELLEDDDMVLLPVVDVHVTTKKEQLLFSG